MSDEGTRNSFWVARLSQHAAREGALEEEKQQTEEEEAGGISGRDGKSVGMEEEKGVC